VRKRNGKLTADVTAARRGVEAARDHLVERARERKAAMA
jgi:hypothetical protein